MKRLSYEPLVVHLFKIFTNTLKLKKRKNKTETLVAFDGKPPNPDKPVGAKRNSDLTGNSWVNDKMKI